MTKDVSGRKTSRGTDDPSLSSAFCPCVCLRVCVSVCVHLYNTNRVKESVHSLTFVIVRLSSSLRCSGLGIQPTRVATETLKKQLLEETSGLINGSGEQFHTVIKAGEAVIWRDWMTYDCVN